MPHQGWRIWVMVLSVQSILYGLYSLFMGDVGVHCLHVNCTYRTVGVEGFIFEQLYEVACVSNVGLDLRDVEL